MGTPVIRGHGSDVTPLGGFVIGQRKVFAEGFAVAAMGDTVSPHPHGNVTMAGTVQATGTKVFAVGLQVARQGDTVTPPCVEPITPTATKVFVA